LPAPVPVAFGEPAEGYPFRWSVCRWVPGSPATPERIADPYAAAADLAAYVRAMWSVDLPGGPPPGDHNFGRGRPLADRDGWVREALTQLGDELDVAAATEAWEEALAAPVWDRAPVWVHGDLHAGNVLADGGRLCAVIDYGGLGVGDPAVDVMPAWTFVAPEARETYRDALGCDDATWARGRGWALSMGLIALPYYRTSSPAIAAMSREWVAAALAG
jgi:aminoglycoside phosphotransferase (APT) family kinase protein